MQRKILWGADQPLRFMDKKRIKKAIKVLDTDIKNLRNSAKRLEMFQEAMKREFLQSNE